MRKVLLLVVSCLILFTVHSCNRITLKVFLPTEYIDEDLVKDFEKEYGFKVKLMTFDSNEEALPLIQSGVYDIIIPSDYAIEELVTLGVLDEINWGQINFNKDDLADGIKTMLSELKNESGFDLLKYSVPYFWGNFGILYNRMASFTIGSETLSALELLQRYNWEALNFGSSTNNVGVYDSIRDMYMVALKELYKDRSDNNTNQPTTTDLTAATSWLSSLFSNSNVKVITDEIYDDMVKKGQEKYALVTTYSGMAIWVMNDNDNLAYYVPSTGTNIYIDAMCIPKNSTNKELAYKFISYFLDKEVNKENSISVAYTSVIQSVIDSIINEGVYASEAYNITFTSKDEIYRYNREIKDAFALGWISVRGQR